MTEPSQGLRRRWLVLLVALVCTVLGRNIGGALVVSLASARFDLSQVPLDEQGWVVTASLSLGAALGLAALFLGLGPEARGALRLERPKFAALLGWTLTSLALGIVSERVARGLGEPRVLSSWIRIYQTGSVPLLALALMLASVFEELFFRGLFLGLLAETRLRSSGAVVVTAALFAAAHGPDSVYRFFDVFAFGVLWGAARVRSGSALTAAPAHVLGNLKVLWIIWERSALP